MFRQVTGERALLTPLTSPRAFQPQAVGFILADDLLDPVSPLQRPSTLAQKHGLGMPDSICHYHQACAHGCLTTAQRLQRGRSRWLTQRALQCVVLGRVHPTIASWASASAISGLG